MELTPLYELRDRLKAGAIAGTALVGEDFRLSRALEALAPLEGASPVFQKIGEGVRALLAADCQDRAAALLEVLSLCDAVLTTQGAVGVSGPVEPMPLTIRGSALTNAPYSVLQPLTEALTSSGGGRYSFIVDTYEQRPALFRDYRVKQALVAALGGSYSELADRAEQWLSQGGPEVAPLLKMGFDPSGKREMVRRIHVMEAVAGAGENDFYRSLLEGGEKEVRAAAAYALRHDEGNAELLVSLCRTEKGAVKKAAHWALARLESPTAWAYWDALSAKKPEQAADYMTLSTAPKAGALIGAALGGFLAPFERGGGAWTGESYKQLRQLMGALVGKSGPTVCDFYRRAAALGTVFDGAPEGETSPACFVAGGGYGRENAPFSAVLPEFLHYSLVLNPAPDLCALAEEQFGKGGGAWAAPALTAILLTRRGPAALDAARPLLKPALSLLGGRGEKKKVRAAALALGALHWDVEEKRHAFSLWYWDPMEERNRTVCRPLPQRLDSAWFAELAGCGTQFDDTLIRCMDWEDRETGPMLAKHFHDSALTSDNNQKYLRPLKQLGWTDYRGLLARFGKGQKRLNLWQLKQYMEELPLCDANQTDELEELLHAAEAGKVGFQGGRGVPDLKALIAERRAAEAAQ